MKYLAKIGGRTFNLELEGQKVLVDGTEVDASFLPTGAVSWSMIVNGRSARVLVEQTDPGSYRVTVDGVAHDVTLQDEHDLLLERYAGESRVVQHVRQVTAPMPGLVRALHVGEGDEVQSGHRLLVLEAMKMENEIRSQIAGRIQALHVRSGDRVEKNQLLVEIGPET